MYYTIEEINKAISQILNRIDNKINEYDIKNFDYIIENIKLSRFDDNFEKFMTMNDENRRTYDLAGKNMKVNVVADKEIYSYVYNKDNGNQTINHKNLSNKLEIIEERIQKMHKKIENAETIERLEQLKLVLVSLVMKEEEELNKRYLTFTKEIYELKNERYEFIKSLKSLNGVHFNGNSYNHGFAKMQVKEVDIPTCIIEEITNNRIKEDKKLTNKIKKIFKNK